MKSTRLLMILLLLFTILTNQPLLAQQAAVNTTATIDNSWQPIAGQHYIALSPKVKPAPNDQSISSVVQFYFWPGSASCYQLELALQKWQLTHPNTEVQRIPLVKRPSWRLLSKAWLVAEELNLADNVINQLYQAIHQQSHVISNNIELEQFIATLNIDTVNFMTVFSSSAINQKLQSIELSNQLLPLKGVPTLIINKQWLSDASMATTSAQLLNIVEHLTTKSADKQ